MGYVVNNAGKTFRQALKQYEEDEMAQYKFDGTKLKKGGTTIANIKGDDIRKGAGTTVIGNISGSKIKKRKGGAVLFNVSGDNICQGNGGAKIATMKDVDKAIDGPGRMVKAALYVLCVR